MKICQNYGDKSELSKQRRARNYLQHAKLVVQFWTYALL